MALNVLLPIALVDIAGSCMAAKTALRLREFGCLAGCETVHAEILSHIEFISKYLDYQVAEPSLRRRNGREDLLKERAVRFSMDGTKLPGRLVGRVHCRELFINSSFRLPDHCSVFQAEVASIKQWISVRIQIRHSGSTRLC